MSGVRFAPSPTGRFHVGNLRTAWISHALARAWGKPWVVRFEDIDTPRVLPGARETQLSDLAALGLVPDRIDTQSDRRARHWEVFLRIVEEGRAYPCFCSRREVQSSLALSASAPHGEPPLYNGRCRTRALVPERRERALAWRFREKAESGAQDFLIARTVWLAPRFSGQTLGAMDLLGDDAETSGFVPSYNWACAIDDFDGDYDVLVRAWDLAHVVPQQRAIARWLTGAETDGKLSAVFHCSVVVQDSGDRLEKRTRGVTLEELRASGDEPGRLIEAFAGSYSSPCALPDRGTCAGEARLEMSISELLSR